MVVAISMWQNEGSSGQGHVKLAYDASMLDWFVVTAERIPRQELPVAREPQALQAGARSWRRSKPEEKDLTTFSRRAVQYPAVRTPLAHPVRVQGNDEGEESDDGSRADESQWFGE
jgi:hypothetical protein